MPRAAGRIDHADVLISELPDSGVERPRQDPGLYELRRLQQSVALACLLGQVLVEVTEKARVPVGGGEVVQQFAGLRRTLAKEVKQRDCAVAGHGKLE
jgi:hypothetical protein